MRAMLKSAIQFAAGVIFGLLLNPSRKGFLKGFLLVPQMAYDADTGNTWVQRVELVPYDKIPYPVNSSFLYNSRLTPILLPSIDSPIHRDQAFGLLCDMLLEGDALPEQEGREWYALTDLKRSGDAIAFAGSYEHMSAVMGAPLYELKDPVKSFKVLLPPSRLRITGAKDLVNGSSIRVALADLGAIKTDGGIISKVGLKHCEYNRDEKPGPMRYVKYSYQIRHNTMSFKSGHKKGKVTYDPALHRLMCKRAGIDHRMCDMIMAHDNIKSATAYEVGQIIEIPLDELRIIKMKLRRIPWAALRLLVKEKGEPNKAAAIIMRYASLGNAHAVAHILQVPFNILPGPDGELRWALEVMAESGGKDIAGYFEDGLGLFIQLLAAAQYDPKLGFYRIPMYGDPFTAIMGRLKAWYFDQVIKLHLGDFSFYAEVAPHLKGNECVLPRNPELLSLVEDGKIFLTGMRPPIVSRGNLQPLVPKRHLNGSIKVNRTDDTIYVSPELLLSMFGDTDGDMMYVAHSKSVSFMLRVRKVVEEPKVKVLATTPAEMCGLIKTKASQVAQASLEVGLRDYAASIIYDERQLSGQPITDDESVRMADEWLENAIKSFKHDGTSIMGEAALACMCQEYGTEAIRKSGKLPKKLLPQTNIFRRKLGARGSYVSDRSRMQALAFELERFYTHPHNKKVGVTVVDGPNAHPYLPIFNALRGFEFKELTTRAPLDKSAFETKWSAGKSFLKSCHPHLAHRIGKLAKEVESMYNSESSFAIAISSYNGSKPEAWWPFCIYKPVQGRKDMANSIFESKMLFQFEKVSKNGNKNSLAGYLTRPELYELVSTGRINTLQKRVRFRDMKVRVNELINTKITKLARECNYQDEYFLKKCVAIALGARVFGMRKDGFGIRNAREFMAIDGEVKLDVYNAIYASPWGLIAKDIWDNLKEHYEEVEEQMLQQEAELEFSEDDEEPQEF